MRRPSERWTLGRHVTTGKAMPSRWQSDAMKTTIDSAGRLVVPKVLRDRLGLTPGSTVDVSPYGAGLHLVAASPTAPVRPIPGPTVAD